MCKDCGCEKRKDRCCEKFEAILTGKQEVPVNDVDAFGRLKVVLCGDELRLSGYFKCLGSPYDEVIGSHIHLGYAGQNGAVVFTLTPELSTDKLNGCYSECENTFVLTSAQVRALKDRQFYVNIHTDVLPAGEIRGQLLPVSHRYFLANLSGDNEVPPVVTTAVGTLIFELNNYNLTASGSFSGLSSPLTPLGNVGSANIHFGPAETVGPIVFPLFIEPEVGDLAADVPASRNVYALTNDQIKLLKEKDYYVNVTTDTNPTGELRAQILKLKYVKPC